MSSTDGERITRLLFRPGPEGEELLERRHAEWLTVGLATEPADRARAERTLERVHALARVEPEPFVHLPSPYALLRAFPSFTPWRPNPRAFGPIREILAWLDAFRERYRPAWTLRLEHRLHVSVDRGFHWQVWRAAFRDVDGVDVPWPRTVLALGQSDVPAVAHRRLLEDLGLWDRGRRSERIALREELARAGGWVWEFQPEGACAIVDRPQEVHMEPVLDGTVRIHREDGPAVTFRDGWEVWAWHGVSVPRRVVEAPATLRPEEIRGEQDTRARQTMLERFGLGAYLEAAGGEVVDDVGEEPVGPVGLRGARLVKGPWRGRDPLAAVCLVDRVSGPAGAPKRHWIRVPPGVATVREAVAWTFRVDADSYRPEIET